MNRRVESYRDVDLRLCVRLLVGDIEVMMMSKWLSQMMTIIMHALFFTEDRLEMMILCWKG